MLEIAVLVRKSSLAALSEHSTRRVGGDLPVSETEALVLLTAETLQRLLEHARPEDTRIDDVIVRLAV